MTCCFCNLPFSDDKDIKKIDVPTINGTKVTLTTCRTCYWYNQSTRLSIVNKTKVKNLLKNAISDVGEELKFYIDNANDKEGIRILRVKIGAFIYILKMFGERCLENHLGCKDKPNA